MTRDAELQRANTLLRRLNAIPDNERLLNDEQRTWLRTWKANRSAPMTDQQATDCYAATLETDYVDRDPMRPDIQAVLNANVPVIYKSDTDDEAAEKYYRYSQNN